MGYDMQELRIYLRLDNSAGEESDNDTRDKLMQEIRDLIEANPDYRRIVTCGP